MTQVVPEQAPQIPTMHPQAYDYAGAIAERGMAAYDHLLIGERYAKEAMLVGFITGKTVLLVGDPNTGKTTLGTDSWRIFTDMEGNSDELAIVPNAVDPIELVGGSIPSSKV